MLCWILRPPKCLSLLYDALPGDIVLISGLQTHIRIFVKAWCVCFLFFSILPHILKSCWHLVHLSHHVSNPQGLDQSYRRASRWENYSAWIIVKAQHFKVNFSINVTRIPAATILFGLFEKKDNMQNMQDYGGEGHISSWCTCCRRDCCQHAEWISAFTCSYYILKQHL